MMSRILYLLKKMEWRCICSSAVDDQAPSHTADDIDI